MPLAGACILRDTFDIYIYYDWHCCYALQFELQECFKADVKLL